MTALVALCAIALAVIGCAVVNPDSRTSGDYWTNRRSRDNTAE